MRRNFRKAIADYDRQFNDDRTVKGAFFASDFYQLEEIARENNQDDSLLWEMAVVTLKAGFMVGYRCAKREQRTRNAKNKTGKGTG